MAKFYKRISFKILTLVVLSFVILTVALVGTVPTYAAASEDLKFDGTNVLDDLKSSEDFSLIKYPYDESNADIETIRVVEYCYSPKVNLRQNYGVYLYFYNPSGKEIERNSELNKVQIATAYNGNGDPIDYEKFELKFCSVSDGDYAGLFYKFKVIDRKGADGKTIADRVNSNERRYDISGVELLTVGANTATEYRVLGTYKFSGYAAGYGIDSTAESSLRYTVDELKAVELEVVQTYYRFNNGVNSAKQINSCYFGVKDSLLAEYGLLQRIKAEWWEYHTTPIVVTSDSALYNGLKAYLGQHVVYDKNVGFWLSCGDIAGDYYWFYNNPDFAGVPPDQLNPEHVLMKLAYVFDTHGADVGDYILPSQTLLDYIYSYSSSSGEYLPIKDGRISADLLTTDVGAGRVSGYNVIDKDADDIFNLEAFDKSSFGSWWYALFHEVETSAKRDIKPIYEVTDSDLLGSDKVVSDNLLIAEEDVPAFRSYYRASVLRGEKVHLFRYAVTDYNAADIDFWKTSGLSIVNRGKAYGCSENVILDFDIIQLTFNKKGEFTIIPVVSSPMDVVSSLTPPLENNFFDWLSGAENRAKKIAAIILLVLLLLLLLPVLPYVVKFLVWLIALPFRLIGSGVKSIKKSVKKRDRE